MRGYDRYHSNNIKNGKLKILSDWSHGLMAEGFKAAQLGVTGVCSKQGLGTDIITHNPYLQVMQNPMSKKKDPVVFVPALYPDIFIIHVDAADKFGNARFSGPAVNDIAIAAAARKLIVTAEEIVSNEDIRWNPKGAQITFQNVDAVVECPFGAVPGYMPGKYYWSRRWWEKLFTWGLESDENAVAFIKEWIVDTKDVNDVINKLGGMEWLVETRRLALAAECHNDDDGVSFEYEKWHPGIGEIYS